MAQGSSRLSLWFVFLTPVWLLGLIFPPTLGYEDRETLQFISLFWLFMLGLLCGRERFLFPLIQREDRWVRVWTFAWLIAITVSAVLSANPLLSLGYVGITAIGLMCCSGLWSCIKDRTRQCLSVYAIAGSAFMTYIYLEGPSQQGRLSLSAISHPNHLALIAFGILVSSLALQNTLLAYALVAINLLVIIATQARSSLLASVIAILTHLFLSQIHRYRQRVVLVFSVLGAVAIGACLLYANTIEHAITSLLFLNDRYRGLGTGFTGRTDAWQEAYQLFLDNPLFGVGFRMHEQYMTTLSSAHNGYLSMLAETGLVGVICVTTLTILCTARLCRLVLSGDTAAITGVSMTLGYLFLAVFERFFINFGNPTSILVWLLLFMPARGRSPRRRSSFASVVALPRELERGLAS